MQKKPNIEPLAIEHLPSCGAHCVKDCGVSPRGGPTRGASRSDPQAPLVLGKRRPRSRVLHVAPVEPPKRGAPPLWEWIDDWGAVTHHREVGTEIVTREGTRQLVGLPLPQPNSYTRHERVDERYSLDRWTRPGGVKDRELDELRRAGAEERRNHAKEAPDVGKIAALVRRAFAGVIAGAVRPAVAVKKRRAGARLQELLALVVGEAPAEPAPRHAPMFEATEHIRLVFKAHAWALALILFGREKDPLSDYAFGRLFNGEPIREQRAPFASPAHVLAVASMPLPGLGGGSCPWPQDDPRMNRRTYALPGEMRVSSVHHGTEHVRGEAAVHRVLTARAAVDRAGLTPHEQTAVEVLGDRELTRDEKALRLREIEADRLGVVPLGIDGITSIGTADSVRQATVSVSDTALFRCAKAAARKLGAAVDRVSRAGDALAPKREQKPRSRPAARPLEPLYIPSDAEALAGG